MLSIAGCSAAEESVERNIRPAAMSEERTFRYMVYHLKVQEIVRPLQSDIINMDRE